LMFSSKV